jgi:hypothetical protein
MESIELSLLPLKKQERANAREVAQACTDFLGFINAYCPNRIDPAVYDDLKNIKKSRLTDEQKKEALEHINALCLLYRVFGVEHNEGPQKNRRMG